MFRSIFAGILSGLANETYLQIFVSAFAWGVFNVLYEAVFSSSQVGYYVHHRADMKPRLYSHYIDYFGVLLGLSFALCSAFSIVTRLIWK